MKLDVETSLQLKAIAAKCSSMLNSQDNYCDDEMRTI